MSPDVKIAEALRGRSSSRVYDPVREFSEGDVRALLEAARWAPSGGNGQPWRFVTARRGDAQWAALVGLLVEGNRVWAQHASLLILTCAVTVRTLPDGRTTPVGSAMHDAGMANMSMLVEATERGWKARVMGGFDREQARQHIAGAGSGIEPVTMMAVGYAGDGAHLTEELRGRDAAPRTRLSVDELRITLP